MLAPRILVIDDEKNIRRTLGLVLEGEGYEVVAFGTAKEGLSYLEKNGADLLILDIKLPGMSGVAALQEIRTGTLETKNIPIIMISGHASLAEAVETVRQGATDFFEKPLDREEILIRVANCLKQRLLVKKVEELSAEANEQNEIIGESSVIKSLFEQIKKVAATKSRVLITGESGTGKELIARALHRLSPRVNNSFIKVNCAAIPNELIESELFGYEKGAFTGASSRKTGQFELAHNGTLFLDEIGDMSLGAQAKVLRVLQSGEINRVGSQKTINVDVRVLAATNKNLEQSIKEGLFREDLFFRLNVVPLKSPPLRKRLDDVSLLFNSFIKRFCKENGYPAKQIDEKVINKLCAYDWPGNIRELKNMAERLVIMGGATIKLQDLPESIAKIKTTDNSVDIVNKFKDQQVTLKYFKETTERQFIIETLKKNNWNISKSAQVLSIERTNLHKKIKVLKIKRDKTKENG